jgi:predicted transcriptional regulator
MSPRRRPRSPDNPGDDSLPEAELEVLACLHAAGEAEAAEVRRRLSPFRPMSHASVLTLLRRLERKDLVRRRPAATGKAHLYRAVPEPGATYRGVAGRLLRRVFAGDAVSLVASVFDGRPPDAEELARLRALVAELERDDREGRP